jgi:hypothetical protein
VSLATPLVSPPPASGAAGTLYVVMDIGCRECGAPSKLVYVGPDRDRAETEWKTLNLAWTCDDPETVDVRSPDGDLYGPWPDDVIALRAGSDYAHVLYEWSR